MIRKIEIEEYKTVMNFLEKDVGRNYFMLLGLINPEKTFEIIYGEFKNNDLKALLFKRNSQILQFYALDEFDLDGFVALIKTLKYKGLIGAKSYCQKFCDKGIFSEVKEGGYIAKLDKNNICFDEPLYKVKKLREENLDEILEIYKESFSSFASKEVMTRKLSSKRGRGLYIEENGKILSVAQTDFDVKGASLIVGVATRKEYRCRGLASDCMKSLLIELAKEGKDVYLQYDNLEAGKIYERLGFRIIDRILHFKN